MNGYAEILQEIEKNNEELRNLNRSRDAIKNAEKDMPREEFQKELSTVERFLASEQLKLENNKNIIVHIFIPATFRKHSCSKKLQSKVENDVDQLALCKIIVQAFLQPSYKIDWSFNYNNILNISKPGK